jgi:osmotically-inducible protein OsmY
MVNAVAVSAEIRLPANQTLCRPSVEAALVERARARLQADSHRLNHVFCDYHRGALRLRGEVPTYYLKQVAQSLLLSLSGDHPIQNELTVIP